MFGSIHPIHNQLSDCGAFLALSLRDSALSPVARFARAAHKSVVAILLVLLLSLLVVALGPWDLGVEIAAHKELCMVVRSVVQQPVPTTSP